MQTTSCLVYSAEQTDRMSHSVLTCVHREGEPGEAAPPGDWLCQPDGGAAVLGKLPEDALRRKHHERVSGGRVRGYNHYKKFVHECLPGQTA